MQKRTTQRARVGSVHARIALQLFATHLIACIVAVEGAVAFTTHLPGYDQKPVMALILLGSIVGFLLTLNIQQGMYVIEIAISRLVCNLPIEKLTLHFRWPLTQLFTQVNVLSQHTGIKIQRELQTVQYQDQLLQQIGKAAAQEERNRLARDLHDSIKQQIFSIKMSAKAAQVRWETDPIAIQAALDDILVNAKEAQVEMEALLQQLRPTPLENIGLIEALRVQCQALGYRTNTQVVTQLDDLPADDRLPLGTQEMVFRIVQEAFANIARHSRADNIWLTLCQQDETLFVEIRDNGKGFDTSTARTGMGLINIRDRVQTLGGRLSIESTLNKGTTLQIRIPLVDLLRPSQEQQEADEELERLLRKTKKVLQIGDKAVQLAILLILLEFLLTMLNTPFSFLAIGLSILVALCSYVLSYRYRTQIFLSVGSKSLQNLSLKCQAYKLLASIFMLSGIYTWYLYIFGNHQPFTIGIQIALGISCVFGVLALLTFLIWYRTGGHYYSMLPQQKLHLVLKQSRRFYGGNLLVWFLVVGLTLLLKGSNLTLVFPPPTELRLADHTVLVAPLYNAIQLTNDIGVVILAIWFITIMLGYLQVVHLQRNLTEKEA